MKKISVTFLAILFSLSTFAQFMDMLRFNGGGMLSVQWDMAKPIGPMSDFVKNTSFKGVNIDYRHCYKNNIILGGRTGWNHFYENKGLTNIEDGNTTTYSRLVHKVNAIPIMLVADYMVNSDKFIPYVGIGIGAYYISSSITSNNLAAETNSAFYFGVSPEVGVTIPFIISNFGLNLGTRYNYALGAGNSSGYSWFSFGIGLSFMY